MRGEHRRSYNGDAVGCGLIFRREGHGRFSFRRSAVPFLGVICHVLFRADSRSRGWESVHLDDPEGTFESFDSHYFGVAPRADLWRDADFVFFSSRARALGNCPALHLSGLRLGFTWGCLFSF